MYHSVYQCKLLIYFEGIVYGFLRRNIIYFPIRICVDTLLSDRSLSNIGKQTVKHTLIEDQKAVPVGMLL